MLADFSGTLLADCYSGFEGISLRSNGRIQRAACVAHARRKVFDAKETYPLEASLVLAKFQQFYDIEDRGKLMSPEERRQLRQSEATVVWASGFVAKQPPACCPRATSPRRWATFATTGSSFRRTSVTAESP